MDIIFQEATIEYGSKLGVCIGSDPRNVYTTTYGSLGEYQLNGNLLKTPVDGQTWVKLSKHVSSTPLKGGNFPTYLISKTN